LDYLLIFLISIFTSAASATVGLGGGILLIPFIILIFALPVKYVAGTMLLAMVPYTAIATIRNLKNGYVNFKIGLIMEIGSIAGVLLGAHFSAIIPNVILKIVFILIVIYLLFTLKIPKDSPYNYIARGFSRMNIIPPYIFCQGTTITRCSSPALIFVGIVAGIFSGMLGIGGGFLKTPVLLVGLHLPPKEAVGTALFMIMITAFFGAAEHIYLHHINYQIALIISCGMMIGAYIGTTVLKKSPEEQIKQYIFIVMLVAGILALFR
jgi:uncharacterized membrane protein YfcA